MQAVLRIKFARTITLAISMAGFVEYYVIKLLLPFAAPFTAAEFVHWLPTVFSTFTRGVFVWFARTQRRLQHLGLYSAAP